MRNKIIISMLTIACISACALSGCNDSEEKVKQETTVVSVSSRENTSITEEETTEPTEVPTVKATTNSDVYGFDEEVYYSTPEGVFMKPIDDENRTIDREQHLVTPDPR